MDVNGARFHLIDGEADWEHCCALTEQHGPRQMAWHTQSASLQLSPQLGFFLPRGQRVVALLPTARRGAAFDRFGNRYWIGQDQRTLYWQPAGSGRPARYWQQTAPTPIAIAGTFAPHLAQPATVAELAGLVVTAHHYLVVGNLTAGGLFVFDLHAGGEPVLLLFPHVPFAPYDLAAAPNGGVWVLDRLNQRYWGLDRHFQVLAEPTSPLPEPPSAPLGFRPLRPSQNEAKCPPTFRSSPPALQGFRLDGLADLVGIAALPDGSVLLLNSPVRAASTLYHYQASQQLSHQPLPDLTGIVASSAVRPVSGHAFAYVPASKTLYVVERDGNQVIAFSWNYQALSSPLAPLAVQPDYLPLHAYGSRALVAWQNQVFYDVALGEPGDGSQPIGKDTAVRWVQLQVIDQPRYVRQATLYLPILDGKEPNCVWHRLFLDGCIPPETEIAVWTRAENDKQLLPTLPFTPEPTLYRRGRGTELPYYQPGAPAERSQEHTGTWELLFQAAHGRYLQIMLVVTGNGRLTPQLRTLRAYYPRFSYPKHYLPVVYQEDAESAHFLERMLANLEGFYTEIEGKITGVSALFDANSAPTETLDWLASWLGLMLDPLWARLPAYQTGALGAGARATPLSDRRRLFIRYALRLYERRGTPEGIQFALHLLLDPGLERLLARLRAATVKNDLALHDELTRLQLPYPRAVMSEPELEALLYDYLLSPLRPSKVRLVERFQTRQGRALAAGDPSQGADAASRAASLAADAHRFSVLVPEDLLPEETTMVERIVQLEKPAHTQFDVRRYWDYFRVGEARLGLDTVLGEEGRFRQIVLGRHYLAEGYLSAAHPMDVTERLVSDRDQLGQRAL